MPEPLNYYTPAPARAPAPVPAPAPASIPVRRSGHSGAGLISVGLFVAVLVAELLIVLQSRVQPPSDAPWRSSMPMAFAPFILWPIGVVLACVGLIQRRRRRGFAVLGLILYALPVALWAIYRTARRG